MTAATPQPPASPRSAASAPAAIGKPAEGVAAVSALNSSTPALLQPEEQVLSTLNADGSRRWLRPRVSSGRFLRQRWVTAWALIALFTLLPWIEIGGRPAVLLDVAQRQFTLFGFTFLPTDTVLLALFLLGSIVSIFLVTALAGRVWCGWACPQTVYLEFVYRPIERFFERTAGRGGRPRTTLPLWRRFAKLAVFLLISMFLAHTFLAYFVGVDALQHWMRRSPLEHPLSFLLMASVTAMMMFDFSFFREQTCILACPYGRLQSVLLDRQSLIISYDPRRGEPRGRRGPHSEKHELQNPLPVIRTLGRSTDAGSCRGAAPEPRAADTSLEAPDSSRAAPNRGDCIDCNLCVNTCPTGIDIRSGLQMECIGCAQCIDACDAVMEKIGKPRGLIRYSSQAAIADEAPRRIRPRVIFYPAILLAVGFAFTLLLAGKQSADVTLLRGQGAPFTRLADGLIANPLRIKITNRTARAQSYALSVVEPSDARLLLDENPLTAAGGVTRTEGLLLAVSPGRFVNGSCHAVIRIQDGAAFSRDIACQLFGPSAPSAEFQASVQSSPPAASQHNRANGVDQDD